MSFLAGLAFQAQVLLGRVVPRRLVAEDDGPLPVEGPPREHRLHRHQLEDVVGAVQDLQSDRPESKHRDVIDYFLRCQN